MAYNNRIRKLSHEDHCKIRAMVSELRDVLERYDAAMFAGSLDPIRINIGKHTVQFEELNCNFSSGDIERSIYIENTGVSFLP